MVSFSSLLCVCTSLLSLTILSSAKNEFDTYNADKCERIRRPWNSLTASERELYISGILKLRENGNGNVLTDDLISVASEHETEFGSKSHTASIYFFWHNYLVFEIESRIRNLGGKYEWYNSHKLIQKHCIHSKQH